MENETVTIYVTRGNFISLGEVEAYIRDTITRYTNTTNPLQLTNSNIRYHNGLWSASLDFSSPRPVGQEVEPDFGW